jgi:hypothetical protein
MCMGSMMYLFLCSRFQHAPLHRDSRRRRSATHHDACLNFISIESRVDVVLRTIYG